MYNPSYLVTSRHNIYYFRYPLPASIGFKGKRVSISLETREPRKALQLANMLVYHTKQLLNTLSVSSMDYSEIQKLVTTMMRKWLDNAKQKIDKDGPLIKGEKAIRIKQQEDYKRLIENESYEELAELLGEKESLEMNNEQLEKLGIEATQENYNKYIKAYAYNLIDYHEAVLDYNKGNNTNAFAASPTSTSKPKTVYTLGELLDKYIEEYTPTVEPDTAEAHKKLIGYLIDLYGADYDINLIDDSAAREVKDLLIRTPSNRNKKTALRDLTLKEQVELDGFNKLATRSVIKHLKAHSAFFEWVRINKYIKENPFKEMSVKTPRVESERDIFNNEEVQLIFTELGKKSDGLANTDMKYWGTLLFFYTGARLEEIASLTAEDIKQDINDIWYISITDHKKEKRTNKKAIRLVPIHSNLIDKGFLAYVNRVKRMKGKDLRLLYELTYTSSGWGRKLSRWFNETLLTGLGIKTKDLVLHSTRGTFVTAMKSKDIEHAHVDYLAGHSPKGVSDTHYAKYNESHLPKFKEVIEKLEY